MDHREMYRKVEFTFDDESRREYISGSVELTEKACIDMEYKLADKFQKITGNFRWFINGLAIVMQDYNEGILKENGNQFIEIRYFDEDLKEKKYYCGFINDFSDYGSDNVAFRSIRMLYRFVKDLIEETKFQSLKGVSVEDLS